MRPGHWPTQRAQMTLGACIAVLLAGILGLAWWLWRHGRNRAPPTARLRRTRAALVTLGLLVIAVGASWRGSWRVHPFGRRGVLGPAQLAVLSALGAIIVATPFVVRYRRAAAEPRGQR